MWHHLPKGVVSLLLAFPWRHIFPLFLLLRGIEWDGVPFAGYLLYLLRQHLLISLYFIDQLDIFLKLLQETSLQLLGAVGFRPSPPC